MMISKSPCRKRSNVTAGLISCCYRFDLIFWAAWTLNFHALYQRDGACNTSRCRTKPYRTKAYRTKSHWTQKLPEVVVLQTKKLTADSSWILMLCQPHKLTWGWTNYRQRWRNGVRHRHAETDWRIETNVCYPRTLETSVSYGPYNSKGHYDPLSELGGGQFAVSEGQKKTLLL